MDSGSSTSSGKGTNHHSAGSGLAWAMHGAHRQHQGQLGQLLQLGIEALHRFAQRGAAYASARSPTPDHGHQPQAEKLIQAHGRGAFAGRQPVQAVDDPGRCERDALLRCEPLRELDAVYYRARTRCLCTTRSSAAGDGSYCALVTLEAGLVPTPSR